MSDLAKQVYDNSEKLKSVSMALANDFTNELPANSMAWWKNQAEMFHLLKNTTPIFSVREEAWNIVKSIKDSARISGDSSNIDYMGVGMDLSIARHLALLSYVTVTWSIYDRLANVCGRLSAVEHIANNPKQNPKICESFLKDKNKDTDKKKNKSIFGYSCNKHINDTYGKAIKISYKIRNWLVHEGYTVGTTRLFSDKKTTNAYLLHEDAIRHILSSCNDDNPSSYDCICGEESCWCNNDLLIILERYHDEADTMFSAFVQWSVSTFEQQIMFFGARYKC